MSEQDQNQLKSNELEVSPDDVSTNEVIGLLRELKDQGVDFEEEDIELILGDLQHDEAIGYLIFAMEEAGLEDPVGYLKEKGILE